MYFPEDRRTDLQDASGKVLGPQGISCVHPKEVRGLPEKAAGDSLCRATAKQKAARHWKECVSRCCCQVQPGTALGQSLGITGKGPFVFA